VDLGGGHGNKRSEQKETHCGKINCDFAPKSPETLSLVSKN
jgi:hypothetical protein